MVSFVAGNRYPGSDLSLSKPNEPIGVPRSDRAVRGPRHCHADSVTSSFSG